MNVDPKQIRILYFNEAYNGLTNETKISDVKQYSRYFVFKVDMHTATICNCVIPENYQATPLEHSTE